MYAKYVTNASSTAAQVANDIAKLCSGASVASLSASCDKVNSQIQYNTVAPGWTIVDNAGPSSGTVISAPDAAGLYTKYVNIYATTYFIMTTYETYSIGTHTGTNISTVGSNFAAACSPTYSTTGIQTFYVYATPRTIFIINSTGTLTCSTVEFSRDARYLNSTTSTIYPCHGVAANYLFMNNNFSSIPGLATTRVKHMSASGDITGTNAILAAGAILGLYYTSNPGQATTFILPMRDSTDTMYHPITPMFAMYLQSAATANQSTPIGKIYDVQLTTSNYGSGLDTISDGVDTYIVMSPSMVQGNLRPVLKLA